MAEFVKEKTTKDLLENCSVVSYSAFPRKETNFETDQLEDNFSSPTPVRRKEPSRIQSKCELIELPEKYRSLLELFERMTSSLRLLGLRKRTPNFQSVSSQVEILTGRKFQFSHLAQMKYVLPEAVEIEKILVHDEETNCMKPDVKIALQFDVVNDHHEESESVFVALSKIFNTRLRDFILKHPEACDIPEAALPEPFGRRSVTIEEDSISKDSPDSNSKHLSTLCETEKLSSTHLPPTFKRVFYAKPATAEMETTDILSPVNSDSEVNRVVENVWLPPGSPITASTSESTPMKPIAGGNSVHVETPVQSTPMRSISPTRSVLTCEDESKTTPSQKPKQSTGTAKKMLDFYSVDGEETIPSRKQTSVCTSDLVFSIHQIFQSVKFGPITKEELVHKIIMNSLEFDDRSEVETQMEYLEKLVPDWFCKKIAPSGDLLYNVNKVSDLKSVRERIKAI